VALRRLEIHSGSSEKLLFVSSPLSSVGVCMFQTIISHQQALSLMYNILSPTNSTILIADLFPYLKNSPTLSLSFLFFSKKICKLSTGSMLPLSHLTSCTSTKSKLCFAVFLATDLSDCLQRHQIFQILSFPVIYVMLKDPNLRIFVTLCNKIISYSEGLLAPFSPET
jgi:hypothetical protein